jgi:Chaperone of endosialidase
MAAVPNVSLRDLRTDVGDLRIDVDALSAPGAVPFKDLGQPYAPPINGLDMGTSLLPWKTTWTAQSVLGTIPVGYTPSILDALIVLGGNKTTLEGPTTVGTTTTNASLTVNGTATVTGDTTVGAKLIVNGTSTLSGITTVGATGANASLTVNGNSTVTGNNNVTGTSTLTGNTIVGASGATGANASLTVNGNSTVTGNNNVTGTSTLTGNTTVGASGATGANASLTVNGTINVTGDVVAMSDARLKQDVLPIEGALDKVLALQGVTYRMKSADPEETGRKIGVIAQEVEAVVPELVITNPISGMKAVAYQNMAGLFIESFKQQQAQLEEMRAQIAALQVRCATCGCS